MDKLVPYPKFQAFDANGNPLSGGKVYTYEPGGTTPLTTYKERALSNAHDNPIVLDSRGEIENAHGIYCSDPIKIVLKDSDDTTIWTMDSMAPANLSVFEDSDGDTSIDVSTGNKIVFECAGGDQMTLSDGDLTPETNNDLDLGTSAKKFKEVHFIDAIVGEVGAGPTTAANEMSVYAKETDSRSELFARSESDATELQLTNHDFLNVAPPLPGLAIRAKFEYSDADTLIVNPGAYHHAGTIEQMVYWDSALTFNCGSDGSNANSTGVQGTLVNGWNYIYIDDSALSGPVITAARLLNNNTAPTWSDAKKGWYSGNDRCIFAVYVASNDISEFHQEGDKFLYADEIEDLAATDPGDDFSQEATLTIPAFARVGMVTFYGVFGATDGQFSWRTEGQTGSTGHRVLNINSSDQHGMNTVEVIASSNLKIDVKHSSAASTSTIAVYTNGFRLPTGF
jgi:hypothetical protein